MAAVTFVRENTAHGKARPSRFKHAVGPDCTVGCDQVNMGLRGTKVFQVIYSH